MTVLIRLYSSGFSHSESGSFPRRATQRFSFAVSSEALRGPPVSLPTTLLIGTLRMLFFVDGPFFPMHTFEVIDLGPSLYAVLVPARWLFPFSHKGVFHSRIVASKRCPPSLSCLCSAVCFHAADLRPFRPRALAMSTAPISCTLFPPTAHVTSVFPHFFHLSSFPSPRRVRIRDHRFLFSCAATMYQLPVCVFLRALFLLMSSAAPRFFIVGGLGRLLVPIAPPPPFNHALFVGIFSLFSIRLVFAPSFRLIPGRSTGISLAQW